MFPSFKTILQNGRIALKYMTVRQTSSFLCFFIKKNIILIHEKPKNKVLQEDIKITR